MLKPLLNFSIAFKPHNPPETRLRFDFEKTLSLLNKPTRIETQGKSKNPGPEDQALSCP